MTTLRIGYPGDDRVRLEIPDDLPEHEEIWVWDLLFAATLHECHGEAGVAEWQEDRATWAVNMAGKVFLPPEEISADGRIRFGEVTVETGTVEDTDPVEIELVHEGSALPGLRARWPDDLPVGRRLQAVDALGQFFMDRNRLFLRELPLHLLAMQKFYQEERSAADPESVGEAPVYALNKAMEYFESRRQELSEPVSFFDGPASSSSS
ncbi:MAG: hypothetical protein ACOC48_01840 [Thiohalospira sp.]|uniref:hypothetical protein n=1 Tax=Thiohalospira sp. TaxID=3080549 RepID=UPI00397FD4C5